MSRWARGWFVFLLSALPVVAQETNPAATLFTEASKLQNAGKFGAARDKWQAFLREHPKDPAVPLVYQGLGACLVETREWPAAIEALQKAMKLLPEGESGTSIRWNLAIAWQRRSEESKDKAHRAQAIAALRDVVDDAKASKDKQAFAKFYLAQIFKAQGEIAAARTGFADILKVGAVKELQPLALMELARLQEDSEDWKGAIDHYRDYLTRFAQNPAIDEARLGLADCLFRTRQAKEAETLFGEIAAQAAGAGADYAHFRWAELAENRGDIKDAAVRWSSFQEKHPKSAYRERGLRRAGEAFVKAEKFDEAAKAFDAWLRENPKHEAKALTQVQLGLVLLSTKKYADAETLLKTALAELKDAEERAAVLRGLARCADEADRPADTVRHYQQLFDSKAKVDEQDHFGALQASLRAGDLKSATTQADTLAANFPKSALTCQGQLKTARALADKGQFEAGSQRCQWVLDAKIEACLPDAHLLAGFCALKQRKAMEAIGHYETLRDRFPKSEHVPMALLSLGIAWESSGAASKALTAYRQLLKNHGEHPLAAQAKKRVQALERE